MIIIQKTSITALRSILDSEGHDTGAALMGMRINIIQIKSHGKKWR